MEPISHYQFPSPNLWQNSVLTKSSQFLHALVPNCAFPNSLDRQQLTNNTQTLLDNCPGLSCQTDWEPKHKWWLSVSWNSKIRVASSIPLIWCPCLIGFSFFFWLQVWAVNSDLTVSYKNVSKKQHWTLVSVFKETFTYTEILESSEM